MKLFLLASFFFDGAIFKKLAFVVFFPGAGEADFKFDQVFLKMRVKRNEREAFFVESANKRFDFGGMKEEAASALGVIIGGCVFGLVGRDLGIQKPRFVVF